MSERAMTDDELDALPENGGIDRELRTINGVEMWVPVQRQALALYVAPDDPLCIHDRQGRAWMIGSANGVKYKSRLREFDEP